MRLLHLIRKLNDSYSASIVAAHAADATRRVMAVYLQDAVLGAPIPGVEGFALDEDCAARGVSPKLPVIGYDELTELIFECDRVFTW